jgi:Flp pilus assembly pilin Flp
MRELKKLIGCKKGEAAVEYAVLVGIFGFLGIFLLNFTLSALGISLLDVLHKLNAPKP